MGRAQKPALIQCTDPATFAEQLNTYYSRFDMPHPQNDWTLTSGSSLTVDKRKYADDMALVADIKDHSSLAAYYQQVNTLMLWIKESSLSSTSL
ncbi:unnamed protein product [Arctogadus glacialis]